MSRLFEVIESLGRVYLVTEWVRGGELFNHISQTGPLKEQNASILFKQLLLAVKHMVQSDQKLLTYFNNRFIIRSFVLFI